MISKKLAFMGAAAAMVVASPAFAAELIVNGGFETGTFAGYSVTPTPAPADGQIVLRYGATPGTGAPGGFNQTITPDTITPGGTYGAYFYADNATQTLGQSINVVANTIYRLSLDYYLPQNGANNPGDANLAVTYTFGNQTGQLFSQTGGSGQIPTNTWINASGLITSPFSGPVALTLTFRSMGGAGTAADFVVDNLSVAAVPEPTTWAMMVLGFGAVGFAARRRSRSQGRFVVA